MPTSLAARYFNCTSSTRIFPSLGLCGPPKDVQNHHSSVHHLTFSSAPDYCSCAGDRSSLTDPPVASKSYNNSQFFQLSFSQIGCRMNGLSALRPVVPTVTAPAVSSPVLSVHIRLYEYHQTLMSVRLPESPRSAVPPSHTCFFLLSCEETRFSRRAASSPDTVPDIYLHLFFCCSKNPFIFIGHNFIIKQTLFDPLWNFPSDPVRYSQCAIICTI